jgi:hypothetical protein
MMSIQLTPADTRGANSRPPGSENGGAIAGSLRPVYSENRLETATHLADPHNNTLNRSFPATEQLAS